MRRHSHLVSRLLLPVVVVGLCTGCGSSSSSPTAATAGVPAQASGSAASSAPVAPIVGRWQQLHTCAHLVRAFRAAGLGDMAALQAAAFWPDRPDSELPSPAQVRARAAKLEQGGDLCAGAHPPFRHSHFFSPEGLFGSLDEHLQQVDDGTYQVRGDTLVIGPGRFRYSVTNGDTLTLQPLLTASQRRGALAHPQEFSDGMWMVSVAYAGSTWRRVACLRWC